MITSKKISWHATAIAAAALFTSGAAQADHRDGGHRGYRDSHRSGHERVWRDHDRHYYQSYRGNGYRYPPHRRHDHRSYYRSYYRPSYGHYYGYDDYYRGVAWPADDFGATITLSIPLR